MYSLPLVVVFPPYINFLLPPKRFLRLNLSEPTRVLTHKSLTRVRPRLRSSLNFQW